MNPKQMVLVALLLGPAAVRATTVTVGNAGVLFTSFTTAGQSYPATVDIEVVNEQGQRGSFDLVFSTSASNATVTHLNAGVRIGMRSTGDANDRFEASEPLSITVANVSWNIANLRLVALTAYQLSDPGERITLSDGNLNTQVCDSVGTPQTTFAVNALLQPISSTGGTYRIDTAAGSTWALQALQFEATVINDAPEEVPYRALRPLAELDLFNADQPTTFSFRNDYLSGRGYSVFSNTISQSFGHAPKMFSEERVASIDNQPLMAQYALDRPEKMLLCHYNFKSIKIMQHAEFAEYFPGHWIYYPGSVLPGAIAAGDTQIAVANAANILVSSVIALIPLDPTGAKRWNEVEFAAVSNKTGNVLAVQRGLFRTTAQSHAAGTVFAVLPDLFEGEADTSFRFNWSADCPRDGLGRNCGDVFARMMARYFEQGQPLERMHGILADVLFWKLGDPVAPADASKRRFDTDGDGLGDNGYDASGENRFALGVYDMVRQLRTALGPNRIFSGDGNGVDWPRLPHLFSGMESEGLSHWDDPFATDWSSNINNFRYWHAHQGFPQSLNYIVDKLPTLTEAELAAHQLHLQRLAGAVAAILDIGVTANGTALVFPERRYELYDHLRQGIVNRLGWLGEPDEWMRPAADGPNLFSGTAADWTSSDATIASDTNEAAWRVQTTGDPSGPSSQSMTIRYEGQNIPSGDLFIHFKMKAAPLAAFPTNVYRYVAMTVDGRLANPNTADQLTAVASSDGYSECGFYFREAGPATIAINLEFEGPQAVWIKDFSVRSATDVLVRGFENGVVLANPRNGPHTFDLAALFPDRICWRLTGNGWEDPSTHTGEPVADPVTVPALDGLFLRSEPDTDHDRLSDRWELLHAGNLDDLGLPGTDSTTVDFDGDGVSDAAEFGAGTSPTDPSDMLMASFIDIGATTTSIGWDSQLDRYYSVLWSTNLTGWSTVPGPQRGTGLPLRMDIANSTFGGEPPVFFRVAVRPL